MKPANSATTILPPSSIVRTTIKTMMMLFVLAFQISLHAVQGTIDCGGITATPGGDVCDTNTNTFLCDEDADLCANEDFEGVVGITSKCVGSSTQIDVCTELDVVFDLNDSNEQVMTCDGPLACIDIYVIMSEEKGTMICKGGNGLDPVCPEPFIVGGSMICEGPGACVGDCFCFDPDPFLLLNFEKGTLTCKGGTELWPACDGIAAEVGCLICEDKYSCTNFEVFTPEGDLYYPPGYFFRGSFGSNCPKDKKKAKPSLSCFSGTNTVEVQNKGITTLDSINIGDRVKTGVTQDGQIRYSPIISWMHRNRDVELKYLQIFTNTAPHEPLEISDDHFLYLHNNKVVRARDVRVGDRLKGDTANMVVTHIEYIRRQGVYAPATESGKIWLSGVTTSCYVSLINEDIMSPNMHAALSHMALGPLRMVCKIGSFSICQHETHSDNGFSMNLWTLIMFGHQLVALSIHMQLLVVVVVVPLLLAASGLELVFLYGIWASFLIFGYFITVFKMKAITKTTM
jgi:hypothetical protein